MERSRGPSFGPISLTKLNQQTVDCHKIMKYVELNPLKRAWFLRTLIRITLLLLLVSVSACQTSQTTDNNSTGTFLGKIKPSGNTVLGGLFQKIKPSSVVGAGPVKVALILHQSGPLAEGGKSIDYVGGASLAVKDLAPETITLSMFDAASDPDRVGEIVKSQIRRKSVMIIVPGDKASVSRAQASSQGRVPLVAMGASIKAADGHTYAFVPDGLTSVIEGIRSEVSPNKRKLALILSSDQVPEAVDRIGREIADIAELHVAIAVKPDDDLKKLVTDNRAKLRGADLIVFASKNDKTVELVDEVARLGKSVRRKIFIGRDDWNSKISSHGLLSRAKVATLETTDFDLIADRYDKAYARPVNRSVALAYDLLSVVAGLTRSGTDGKISKTRLEMTSGFRGSLGGFRFNSDGTVERLYRQAKYVEGALVETGSAPKRF